MQEKNTGSNHKKDDIHYMAVLLIITFTERMCGLADQVINLDTGQRMIQEDGQWNEHQQ